MICFLTFTTCAHPIPTTYCTVPTLYQLEGVTKEGDHPQSIFQDTEIWKGRYGGEAVVLKVLRGPRDDFRAEKPNIVSTLSDPPVVVLMGEIAVLRGSSSDEAA